MRVKIGNRPHVVCTGYPHGFTYSQVAAFHPDGTKFAFGRDNSNTIDIYDVNSGNREMTLSGHSDDIILLVYNYDGSLLASGSADFTVKIWNMPAGSCQLTLEGYADSIRAFNLSFLLRLEKKILCYHTWLRPEVAIL